MSEQQSDQDQSEQQVVLMGADGKPVGSVTVNEDGTVEQSKQQSPADMIEQPAKVMRIGSMVKQLLEEVRQAPLDEASRTRLREVHRKSILELEEGLAPELHEELERLTLPFTEDSVPSDAELRIAQAQLVGWLEGLFHGIQTALFAQQMAARVQLEQMRGRVALPPGMPDPGQSHGPGGTGQYL
jgi:hypothetical protein